MIKSKELVIGSVPVTYQCPDCKFLHKRNLPWIEPKSLADIKKPFTVRHACRCGLPHEIQYLLLKNRRVRIIEFLSQKDNQPKSFLTKVKKSFKLASNSAS